MPYDLITSGPAEFGIFRSTDQHLSSKKQKKSIFKVIHLDKGKAKEVVQVEISYDNRIKQAMIEVQGDKPQRSDVVKSKLVEDAFPISMLENKHGWKLMARYPADVFKQGHFELFIDGRDFFDYQFM